MVLRFGVCNSRTLTVFHDFNLGPMDLTRKIGEQNVFIPCSFAGEYSTVWEINGALYDESNLPSGFLSFAHGLLIKEIREQLDGVTYRCLYTLENGAIQTSSQGTLTAVHNYN